MLTVTVIEIMPSLHAFPSIIVIVLISKDMCDGQTSQEVSGKNVVVTLLFRNLALSNNVLMHVANLLLTVLYYWVIFYNRRYSNGKEWEKGLLMLAYGIYRTGAIHLRILFSLIFYAKYCLRDIMDDDDSSEMMDVHGCIKCIWRRPRNDSTLLEGDIPRGEEYNLKVSVNHSSVQWTPLMTLR
ncbi:unnamed protein product [Onchocerca flexuosa]|uniref:Rhomboid domain-containing protein n=1 Tax=Onchocerca flexuosa TaxID=387005 RepID=A0A183HYW0_9BILA|nr:unnamed protein product [Onchocerca flexuosa]